MNRRFNINFTLYYLTALFIAIAGNSDIGFATANSEPVIIRLSENETIDITSWPDWHDQSNQGWYIKEHYHADDFALLVCDQESVGAKAIFDLGKTIEPGNWSILVRHVRMRQGGTNILGLGLGNGVGDLFQATAESELIWSGKDKPRNYRWAATVISTNKPVRYLRVTAKQIERTGIGDLPEYPLSSILIDTIILTNLSNYEIVHGTRSSGLWFRVEGKMVQQSRYLLEHFTSGRSSSGYENPSKLRGSDSLSTKRSPFEKTTAKGNQLPGGGFDAATQPYWFVLKPKMGSEGYELTRAFLDTENFAQGSASLRLRGFSSFYLKKPASKVTLVSAPFLLQAGEYISSFIAKTEDDPVHMDVRLVTHIPDQAVFKYGPVLGKMKEKAQKKWTAYQFSAKVHKPTYVQMVVYAKGFTGEPDQNGLSRKSFWLDAFSVSDKQAVFSPKNNVEIGLFSNYRRLFYPGKLNFLLRMVAYDDRSEAVLHYEILDLGWKVIKHEKILGTFDNDGVVETALSIPFERYGAYLIRAWTEDAPGSEVVLDFAVLHDPKNNNAPSNLGVYTAYSPDNLAYFKRAGAGYYFSLCDYLFRPYHALKIDKDLVKQKYASPEELLTVLKKADHITHDPVVKRIQDAGIEVIPELLANEMPRWAKGSPAAFGEHAGQVAAHYTKFGIKRWITGDEVRDKYFPYHEAAANAILSENPNAQIMVSTNPGIFDHFAKELKNISNISAIGGSYWNMNKWVYKAEAETARRYDRPFWNIGVGWGSHPIYDYDPKKVRRNLRRGRFSVISNTLYAHSILKPEILVTYTNRFTNGRAFGTNDMFTGTFVPHGVYFALAAGFTRGAKGGKDIELRHASDLDAFYFERNGKTTVVICQSQAFWGQPRGEAAFHLQIDADPTKLGFYDVDLSEMTPPETKNNGFKLNLPIYGMLILEDRGMGGEKLIKAVSNMRAVKTHGTRFMILGRNGGGLGLDLGLLLTNGLERDLSGNVTPGNRVPLAPGAFRKRTLNLLKGESALLRFPLAPKLGTSRPIGNLIAEYTFSDDQTFALGGKAHLWAANSKYKQPDTSSGNDSWSEKDLVGYIFATNRIGGGYGFEQVRKGGEVLVSAEVNSMGLRIFSRWDEKTLRFGFDIDPKLNQIASKIQIMIDPALSAILSGKTPASTPYFFSIDLTTNTSEAGKLKEKKSLTTGGRFIELNLKLNELLHRSPFPGETLGFNVFISGKNPQTNDEIELVFSGRPNYRPNDPNGWAQIIFQP